MIRGFADGRVEDTGSLTRKRMETVEDEFLAAARDLIERNDEADKPWFTCFNSTRMHYCTHVRPEHQGRSGKGIYATECLNTMIKSGNY